MLKAEETTIQASEETGQAVEVKYVPAEVEEEEPEEQQIFQVVEEMPEFPGVWLNLKFLGKNIKYPTITQENGVQRLSFSLSLIRTVLSLTRWLYVV